MFDETIRRLRAFLAEKEGIQRTVQVHWPGLARGRAGQHRAAVRYRRRAGQSPGRVERRSWSGPEARRWSADGIVTRIGPDVSGEYCGTASPSARRSSSALTASPRRTAMTGTGRSKAWRVRREPEGLHDAGRVAVPAGMEQDQQAGDADGFSLAKCSPPPYGEVPEAGVRAGSGNHLRHLVAGGRAVPQRVGRTGRSGSSAP